MDRTCPLGHVCDKCLWQVETQKQNSATGDLKVDTSCAITEMVLAQVATFQQTHSVGAVLESARNLQLERKQQ